MSSTTPPAPPTEDRHLFLLGQIHSMVEALKDGQDLIHGRLDKMDMRLERQDDRLRTLEQRSAVAGAVSGGAMSVGVVLIVEGLKQWLKRGGPSP